MEISSPKPHFFKTILPGFKNGLKIPIDFSVFILNTSENFSGKALLRKKDEEWRVSVRNGCFVGHRWSRFAEENNLEAGDFIVFKHSGNLVFDVTILDGITQCKKEHEEIRQSKKSRFEEEEEVADLGRPRFMGILQKYTINWGYINMPKEFAISNGLVGRNCKIIVEDEQERSWYLDLTTFANHTTRMRGKCNSTLPELFSANGFKMGDFYVFEVVVARNREEVPVLRILSDRSNGFLCYTSTIKPYSVVSGNRCLHIPIKFARSSGLCEKRSMILENKNGRSWDVNLRSEKWHLTIVDGWGDFVDGNGIKKGDAFKFEIVENGVVPLVRFTVI